MLETSRHTAPIAILVTGDPIEGARQARGGFAEMIRSTTGTAWPGRWLELDLRGGGMLPAPADMAALIVTGSASSVVDREAWTVEGERYLADTVAAGVPVLGICYGHQMLAMALGGRVIRNPNGREIGTVDLTVCAEDPLFAAGRQLRRVNATHLDAVVELPPGARRIARTALDENAAVRYASWAWGVQFHPEIDRDVLRYYIAGRRGALVNEGLDADAIDRQAEDAPGGAAVLVHFAEIVLLKGAQK